MSDFYTTITSVDFYTSIASYEELLKRTQEILQF